MQTTSQFWSRIMSISLKKSGMLKLGLSLVAMTVAASVQAKTLVYCSEGSPDDRSSAWYPSSPGRLYTECGNLSGIAAAGMGRYR